MGFLVLVGRFNIVLPSKGRHCLEHEVLTSPSATRGSHGEMKKGDSFLM